MPTPGFVPEHLKAIVEALVQSIKNAIASEQDTEIFISTQHFPEQIPVAWNRSINAYNRNPEVKPHTEAETHLALNREMQLIGFYREQKLQSFISLFGVHATCLGNSLNAYDGDNKGYAAAFSEQALILRVMCRHIFMVKTNSRFVIRLKASKSINMHNKMGVIKVNWL